VRRFQRNITCLLKTGESNLYDKLSGNFNGTGLTRGALETTSRDYPPKDG
jgi:hypothetical protein